MRITNTNFDAQFQISQLRRQLNKSYNNFFDSHNIAGRFLAAPIAAVDVGLFAIQKPLSLIQNAAMTAINLVGSPVSSQCRRDASSYAKGTILSIVNTPLRLAQAPIWLLYTSIYNTFAQASFSQLVERNTMSSLPPFTAQYIETYKQPRGRTPSLDLTFNRPYFNFSDNHSFKPVKIEKKLYAPRHGN